MAAMGENVNVAYDPNEFIIMGYKVLFPDGKKPFPAQFAVMNKVLVALKKQQNALLESPTGSGKTLALLSSSIAWQKKFAQDAIIENQKLAEEFVLKKAAETSILSKKSMQENEMLVHSIHNDAEKDSNASTISDELRNLLDKSVYKSATANGNASISNSQDGDIIDLAQDDDDDLMPISFSQVQNESMKNQITSSIDSTTPTSQTPSQSTEDRVKKRKFPPSFLNHVLEEIEAAQSSSRSSKQDGANGTEMDSIKTIKVPQIFFCSRTHSQLAQVIQELKKCPFASSIKMTLLGSKKHYCVHPKIRKLEGSALNDGCSELLETSSCRYQSKVKQKGSNIRYSVPPVWDIEDMVELGETHKECPYFYTRDQTQSAEIVFCPYNYIIDPQIRATCSIELKNAVVIFDEAHNIEDVCRDAASVELDSVRLDESANILSAGIKNADSDAKINLRILLHLVNGWKQWLSDVKNRLTKMGFEYESKQWDGSDVVAVLDKYCGLNPSNLSSVRMCYESVLAEDTKPNYAEDPRSEEQQDKVKLGMATMTSISSILNVAGYLFRENMKYMNDFKLAAVHQRKFGSRKNEWEYKACIWCLYAGVAFSDITSESRSVILTSGTLSPMSSFAGELGTAFPITLEANHVINMQKQVWLGSIVQGPLSHREFSATYVNQQDLTYQDALGELVLNTCRIVRGGVLVFLPSYRFMTNLQDRWALTRVLDTISAVKTVFVEPRAAGKDFDALLEEFKSCIAESRKPNATFTGALFFAVYRGKVSEGIDFSNDNARAVIAVGIPFPNIKEQQIALKQAYQNDRSRYDKSCAPGRVWYEHQAFRALNQALGRCIRHRLDYGAILLVDSRYRAQRYSNQLSKWTRGYCREYDHIDEALESVQEFFTRVLADEALIVPDEIPIPSTKKSKEKGKKHSSGEWIPKKKKAFFPVFSVSK